MDNLILAFNVVFPLFLMMALGYGLKQGKFFDEHTLGQLNGVVFKVFLPTMVFYNIYTTNLKGALNYALMGFAVLSILIIFVGLCFVIPIIEKDNKKRGVLIQGIFRSNFMIFGLPVVSNLFGPEHVGSASLLLGIVVPIFNVLAVVSLTLFRSEQVNVKEIVKNVFKNPFIIGSILAIILIGFQIKLPQVIEKTISDLSKVASPLALIALGGSFQFQTIKDSLKQIIIGVGGRLVVIPALFITLSILLGFRGVDLTCLMVIFGSPVSVSSFAMAKQMEGDSDLAGHLVVFGSMFSVLTLFLWIFILKQLGFI